MSEKPVTPPQSRPTIATDKLEYRGGVNPPPTYSKPVAPPAPPPKKSS